MFSITLLIIIVTCAVSFPAFSNPSLTNALIFSPSAVAGNNQFYRFFTSGFIHADLMHLAFNMIAFYSFGLHVEMGTKYLEGTVGSGFIPIFGAGQGRAFYVMLYVFALLFALLPTYIQHKNDYGYKSLGASGAVSAIIFAGLLLEPRTGVGLIFIPIAIPGYIFGPVFLLISSLLAKKAGGRINHSAHIWGAIFGLFFVLVTCFIFSDYNPLQAFVLKVKADLGL